MNTRFSITPYHALHLGHVWIARANHDLARATGGKFYLHLHDAIYALKAWGQGLPSLPTVVKQYVEDLAWLGMKPDEVIWSSRNAEAQGAAAEKVWCPRFEGPGVYIMRPGAPGPEADYHPWFAFTAVVDDHEAEIGGFYRGMDLIGQMQLYDYFCCALGWRVPCQQYLPAIRREADLKKISKSDRGESIRDLREVGYTPESIRTSLEELQRRHGMEQQGEGSLVIPAGYLTADKVKPVEFDDYWQMWADEKPGGRLEKEPYAQEARAHLKRMRKRLKKGRDAKLTAAAQRVKGGRP